MLLRDGRGGYAGGRHLRDTSVSFSESFGESSEIEGALRPRDRPAQRLAGPGAARRRRASRADGATAEALTKALLVLGPDEASRRWRRCRARKALVIDAAGALHESAGFRQSTGFEALAAAGAKP